jgi:hypothetical protein
LKEFNLDRRDDANLAEIYLDGKQYHVGPLSIPSEMVETAEASTHSLSEFGDEDKEIEVIADIALRLARRMSDVAYHLLLEPEQETTPCFKLYLINWQLL